MTETSLIINETEEDYQSEHREWFTRQVDRQIKERRPRALRTNLSKKSSKLTKEVIRQHIVENPQLLLIEDLEKIRD